ncbi:MAG: hypothetical protein COV44_11325 [Deltaproteobacteria bacterium CG11_big_fil_rev_8_21_14_0_20_45_16]|nr:MAG: hypothetical protein COV44_11325 [Deltaproteobacteria bacterium CG11_big_fil_rev_8_21_14_0_20_45_16]
MIEFSKIKDWFFKSGRMQLVAVFLAFVAWISVQSGQTVRQRMRFPLDYQNLPNSLVLKKEGPKEVQVTLIGPLHRIRSIDREASAYVIDLSNLRAGLQSFEIESSNFRLPFDVRALAPNPRRIDIELEELKKKEVPIEIIKKGDLAEGYSISKIHVTPDPLQLVGAAGVLDQINRIPLELDVSNRSESFSTSLLVDPKLPGVKTVDSVFVEVEVSRLNVEIVLESVPVILKGLDPQLKAKITPETAKVILEGTNGDVESLKDKLRVEVSAEGLQKGRYRLRGNLNQESTTLPRIDPESFIVEILD